MKENILTLPDRLDVGCDMKTMQAEDEELQKGMSRTSSAFQRATSGKLPRSDSQTEPMPERWSASFRKADRTSVPPLAIAMLVCGTRGDVQPFLALALGLQKDGHRVRLATHAIFKDYVESYGVEFFPMGTWLPRLLCLYLPAMQAKAALCHFDLPTERSKQCHPCRRRPAAAVSIHGVPLPFCPI
jgi:hypothetical protein